MNKELENAWAVQEIWQEKCKKLEEENRRLREAVEIADMCVNNTTKENKKLKSEIENMKKVGRENIETLDRMSIELENYSESFKRYRDFSKQELADSLYDMEEENKKLKAHCNMLESENRLLKEECKARLEKIKELEK